MSDSDISETGSPQTDGTDDPVQLLVEWKENGLARTFHLPEDGETPVCGSEEDITGPHPCKVPPETDVGLCLDCGSRERYLSTEADR